MWRSLAPTAILVLSSVGAPALAADTSPHAGSSANAASSSPPQATTLPQTAPTSKANFTSRLSPYERDVLERVLTSRGDRLEDHPEGKWIESVEAEPLEVFTPEDPLPTWLNVFHTTSRAEVIEREVLLRSGQRYSSELAEESARNLRTLRQLSVVLVVPIRGKNPDRVRILVVTKDVWSLRLNSAFQVKNQTIEYLMLQPSEENLFGQHLSLAAQYTYSLKTNAYGAKLSHQRLFGSRIAVLASLHAIEHRATHELEGSTGLFYFGQPLYSSRAKWSWGTALAWRNEINRHLLPDASGAYQYRRFDDPSTTEDENVPYRYRSRQLSWRTFVTRSFGQTVKRDLTLGLEAQQRQFSARNLRDDGYAADALARFERQVLERSTTSLGPYAQFDVHQNRYVSLYDVDTLGLQEDFPLGARSFGKLYGGTKLAHSSRDYVGLSTGLEYTASSAGALGRAWAIHTTELSPVLEARDGLIQGGLHLVSSPTTLGRFVYDVGAVYRYQDYRRLQFALGGDNRLRGYPSSQFLGRHVIASNLEFRTRSVRLFEVLLGLVGFYDIGDAFSTARDLAPKHSVGVGARATAPQLQRVAARLDVSVPLTRARSEFGEQWGGIDVLFTLSGQAFPFPSPQPTSQSTPIFAEN